MTALDIISSGLLELYVMGIASPEETRQVEAWAKQYPEVAAEIEAIQAVMINYAQANAIEPGANVKDKIFAAIQSTSSPVVDMNTSGVAKVRSLSPSWKYAAAASIILLIGSLVFNYTYYNKYKSANDELQTAQSELAEQKQLAKAMHDEMGVMADKNAVPVSLAGMPDASDAAARIYWMKNNGGDVYIDPSNLPEAPSGMQYQFWGIVNGVPVSGGMITTLKDGRKVHVQKMKSFGKAEAFAVSLEKAGPEKETPSHVIVMGKM